MNHGPIEITFDASGTDRNLDLIPTIQLDASVHRLPDIRLGTVAGFLDRILGIVPAAEIPPIIIPVVLHTKPN